MNKKFRLKSGEEYEMYTFTNDEGKTFGKIIVDFSIDVIIHLKNDDVIFGRCKKIISDEDKKTLYFYDAKGDVIIESRMSIPVYYSLKGETYQRSLYLEDFQHKETLKSFFEGEFGKLNLSESELMNFCGYYSLTLYKGYSELTDRIQSIHNLDYFIMEFVDVEELAIEAGFTKINDNLWFEDYDFTEFEDMLSEEFEGDIFKAIKEWEVYYRGY